ncbi:hypothetical protein OG933_05155 [Streptomyces sp. NBC_00016]|uniref:hypothetical protein n=1 Tax=Streptomyces sp. NBC_00016 TaxID=2975622 RepID=UPI003247F4D1
MNEVLPQLNELLLSSIEGLLAESIEVIDTVVRVEARTTADRRPQGGQAVRGTGVSPGMVPDGVDIGSGTLSPWKISWARSIPGTGSRIRSRRSPPWKRQSQDLCRIVAVLRRHPAGP